MKTTIKLLSLMLVSLLAVNATSCDDNEEPYEPITAEYKLIKSVSGCTTIEETYFFGEAILELKGEEGECEDAPQFCDNVVAYCTPNASDWTVHYTSAINGKIYPLQYFFPGDMVCAPIDSIKTRAINNFDAAHPAGSSLDDVLEVTLYSLDDWFAFKADSLTAADMFEKLDMPADTDPAVLDEPAYTACSRSLAKDFKGTKDVVSTRLHIRPIQLATRPEVYIIEAVIYSDDSSVSTRFQFTTILN